MFWFWGEFPEMVIYHVWCIIEEDCEIKEVPEELVQRDREVGDGTKL